MEPLSLNEILLQSHLSFEFIAQYIATKEELPDTSLESFYSAFCEKNNLDIEEGKNVIFTPATLLGYLYSSFILPQQTFYNRIPQEEELNEDWGITIELNPQNNKTINNILRRLRNALSHGNIEIHRGFRIIFYDDTRGDVRYSKVFDNYHFKASLDFEGFMKFDQQWGQLLKDILYPKSE